MDDLRVGSIVRAVRVRRGLRQADVAREAGLSPSVISSLERGLLEEMTVRSVRRVAAALGIRLPFAPRWRGAEIAKLLDERHAAIVREVAARLLSAGWTSTAEVTFAFGREAGSVDVVGWKVDCRAMLLVEVKSELTDLQDLLAAFDRKRRLAPMIARQLGIRPLLMGAVIVFPAERQARVAVAENGIVLGQSYPARTVEIRRWLAAPSRDIRGIWFVPISSTRNARRVRVPGKRAARTIRTVARTASSVDSAPSRGSTGSLPPPDPSSIASAEVREKPPALGR